MPNQGLMGFPNPTISGIVKSTNLPVPSDWTVAPKSLTPISSYGTGLGSEELPYDFIYSTGLINKPGESVQVGTVSPTPQESSISAGSLVLFTGDSTPGTTTVGSTPGSYIQIAAGAAARLTSGNSDGGDVLLTSGQGVGTGAPGQVHSTNGRIRITSGAPPSISSATGFGAGPTQGFNGSPADSNMQFQSIPGAGPGSSGTLVITFSKTHTNAIIIACLESGSGSWDARATAIISSASSSGFTVNWDNNAVALTAGVTYRINIHAFAN